jgi:hypothetical protein
VHNIGSGAITAHSAIMDNRMYELNNASGLDLRLAPALVRPFPVWRWENIPAIPEQWPAGDMEELFNLNSLCLQPADISGLWGGGANGAAACLAAQTRR